MTPAETVMLTRYVRALCPHQKFDEYTADAWHDIIGDYPFEDCRTAVKAVITRGQAFVGVAEIISEVKRIRSDRLSNSDLAIPAADPNREADYREALGRMMRHLGDGEQPMPFRAIEAARSVASEGPSEEYREIREDAEEKRKAAALAKAREEIDWSQHATCGTCSALLDPDGTCFACTHKADAS